MCPKFVFVLIFICFAFSGSLLTNRLGPRGSARQESVKILAYKKLLKVLPEGRDNSTGPEKMN